MALSKLHLELEVDRILRGFSETLKPFEEYHDTGVRLCEKVLSVISTVAWKTEPITGICFKLPCAYYSGTFNRLGDSCPTPLDFDIHIKVTNRQPPFTEVLDFIETTLRNNAFRLQISPRTIKLTGYFGIQFVFTNGISAKIVPVTGDAPATDYFSKDDRSYKRYYSSNLTDSPFDFIKQQSFYAHTVCRLAKYWWTSMNIREPVIDASLIFDLLATAAVLEEEARGHGREALLRAFTRVVQLIQNLDSLTLGFEREFGQYGPWVVKTCTGGKPWLSEPGNPTRNILQGLPMKAIEEFVKHAKEMKIRIDRLLDDRNYCDIIIPTDEESCAKRPIVEIHLDKLFGNESRGNDDGVSDLV